MFINIDYSSKPKDIKLYLAKPNKKIVTPLQEQFNCSLSLKLGNINELSFSIPYIIMNDNFQQIKNPNVKRIKEKMLIKAVLGNSQTEWFIVDEIEEDSEDADVFNVKAFSLGYELCHKKIGEVNEESINAQEILTQLLLGTTWSIKTIDPMFNSMYRSFEINDDSNKLEAVLEVAKTFEGLIEWDTQSRQISLLNPETYGKFKGLTINYNNGLQSLNKTRTSDELCTRLYIYGNEGISINSVNPTGQSYIEDFSYFMYPFERDENKNVIKSSHFMSDALCHAILDHQDLVKELSPQILDLVEQKFAKQTQLVTEESTLNQLELELENINNLLDIAKATDDQELIEQRTIERNNKQAEVIAQNSVVTTLENEISNIDNQIQSLQSQIDNDPNFTPELKDELNLYIIEKTWRDDRYINPQELYDDGLKKFNELRQPKVVVETNISGASSVVLGDICRVKHKRIDLEFEAQIVEINYNFETEEIDIVVANTNEKLNENEKLIDILYNTSSTSSLVENNKHIWNKITPVSDQVNSILTSEWEANKNKIVAGINNKIEIGNRGIIIRNPDFPDEIVIAQAGIIALSKDGGETWKVAIKPDGIVAERLIGQIIAGENLFITNSNGTFLFDNSGCRIKASSFVIESDSGSNLINDWNNSISDLEGRISEAEFKIQPDQIVSVVSSSEPFLTSLDSKLKNFDFLNDLLYWKENHNLTSPLSDATVIVDEKNNKVVEISGQKSVFYGKMIPIDTSRTYRVKFKVKQLIDPTVSGSSKVFAGVAAFDVNKQPLTSVYYGEHRYCAVAGEEITVADGWVEFEGLITGEGVDSSNQFIEGTKYAVPVFVINANDGDGTVQIDYCSLEDITLENNMDGLATRVSNAEEKITDDSIISTVTQSITYQNDLNGKVNSSDLADYATIDDLNGLENNLNESINERINNIDLSDYVTQSQISQTAEDLTIKFSSGGGINLLRNSVGYAGTDFWIVTGTVNTIQSNELDTKGVGSGFILTDGTISQKIFTTDQWYTISAIVNKKADEYGYLRVSDGVQTVTSTLDIGTAFDYKKIEVKIRPIGSEITVELYGDNQSGGVIFMNIMANVGEVALQWQHSVGEIYNSNIRMDLNGIRVSQIENGREIGFTKMTPEKFAGYYDINGDGKIDETTDEVFRMDKDEFVMKKSVIKEEITMGSIKIVKVNSSDKNGWAFVPIVE